MMITARKMIKQTDDLPTIPAVVAKAVALLDNPDSDPDQIADTILSDQVLAARVIRVVNSPLYGHSAEIASVKRALLYIGFTKIRELILTDSFVDTFRTITPSFDIASFWKHSFEVGALAKRLAEMTGYPDREKAYMVGLVHDIGKVFLGYYHREQYAEMLAAIKGGPYTIYDAEMEVFGTSHSEIGLCLAQRWNFPPSYCDSISYHHTSELATVDPLLTALVTLADFFTLTGSDPGEQSQAASTRGRSEENAWNILRQLSEEPLQGDLEDFMAQCSADDQYKRFDQIF
jgi:putative nucleotidyltransferase with HDIG domain